jgi:hypothetical protein
VAQPLIKRPRFAAMVDAPHRHQYDLLTVWALDRPSREGADDISAFRKHARMMG